ncbi:hypothetical protein KIN20_024018 [Parelaphostrongylus tenuis]|uniref:Uncharacterized protein n=1 Tax=Parelaphostrongylus tenuis TaxID=148309 RepID=A0AAD5QWG5_PARTN|nr:hypothetical protein KIN20_024018 [Parelaphostrongylus tenuis]
MLPKPELTWREVHLTFGRRITLRREDAHLTSQRKRRKTSLVKHQWVFTEDEFLRDFANFFVVLSPYAMYIKCREFDEHIAQILINCIGPMRDKTFALEMDGCLLGENALRSFFAHFSPSYLNLSGRFDRSLISDQTPTRISGVTVRKIVDNWSTQYTGTPRFRNANYHRNCTEVVSHIFGAIPADNDKEFYIIIPECDLKCDDILELFKKLVNIRHFWVWIMGAARAIVVGMTQHGGAPSTVIAMVSDSSQICDNIQELRLSARVTADEEPSQTERRLLDVLIFLDVNYLRVIRFIPFFVRVYMPKQRRPLRAVVM